MTRYQLLSNDVDVEQADGNKETSSPQSAKAYFKGLAFRLLAIFTITYMLVRGLLSIPKPAFLQRGCHGRNSSTMGGLPSHFVLSTGAKIPSVALGVWRAEKDQVGEAVKVRELIALDRNCM